MDVAYLCDRKACEDCHPEFCDHTLDISHARNFIKDVNSKGQEFYREEPPGYNERRYAEVKNLENTMWLRRNG